MSATTSAAARDSYGFQKYIVALSGMVLLVKFFAWSLTGSVAIFTDALESIVNVAAGIIGLYALYLSTRPRDFDHPYGHGRAEYISATVEGAMITIAGVLILMEAVRSILDPREIPHLEIGMMLIMVTVVANLVFGTMAVRRGSANRSQALAASGKHLQSDAYSSIGIISGLVILYILTSMGYDVLWIDGAIALIFGTIILLTGVSVVKGSLDGIMDKVDIQLLEQIATTLNDNRRDEWIDIHNLKIVKYGPAIHIDMHVTMPWYINVKEQREEVRRLISLIREEHDESAELSVSCDPCREFSCPYCIKSCEHRKAEFVELIKWDAVNLSRDEQHGRENDANE